MNLIEQIIYYIFTHKYIHILALIVLVSGSVAFHFIGPDIDKKRYKKKAIKKFESYYQEYSRSGTLVLRNVWTNIRLDNKKVKIGKWVFNLNDIQDVKFKIHVDTILRRGPHFETSIYIITNDERKQCCNVPKYAISSIICFVLILKFVLTKKTEVNQSDIERLLLECEIV